MWLLYTICVLLCVAYCYTIIAYRIWFKKLKPFQPSGATPLPRFFSVIIPARNEADNIINCLQSIVANNYPQLHYEVIVIDDFSTDNTQAHVKAMQQQYNNIKLLVLKEIIGNHSLLAYKKKAIELAIAEANGDWIVTTDADCLVPKDWLTN